MSERDPCHWTYALLLIALEYFPLAEAPSNAPCTGGGFVNKSEVDCQQ